MQLERIVLIRDVILIYRLNSLNGTGVIVNDIFNLFTVSFTVKSSIAFAIILPPYDFCSETMFSELALAFLRI